MKSERVLVIAVVLSMCVWGMSWSSAKVLSSYGNASSIAFLRFVITITTLFILLPRFKVKLGISKPGLFYVIPAGLIMLTYSWLFFYGLKTGMPGAGGVLVTTMNPVFAFVIGLVVSKIVPNKMEIIGLILGVLAGVILLKIWQNFDALFASGNSYFLLAAFLWAVMIKLISNANRFGNAMAFSLWLHVVAAFGFLFIVDFEEVKYLLTNGDLKFWLNILYFGTINSAIATTCFMYASARIGAEKASSFIFIVPTMSVVGALIFHQEPLLWNTVLGGILGVLAVFIINGKLSNKIKNV